MHLRKERGSILKGVCVKYYSFDISKKDEETFSEFLHEVDTYWQSLNMKYICVYYFDHFTYEINENNWNIIRVNVTVCTLFCSRFFNIF